jgi:hypothetical protein
MDTRDEVVGRILRGIDLNERWQLLALAAPRPATAAEEDVVREIARRADDVDVLWVGTGEGAIQHVLSDGPTLTIYDARDSHPLDVEGVLSVLNSNRDTMARTRTAATLLVVVHPDMLGRVGLVAQDLWSCRSSFAL